MTADQVLDSIDDMIQTVSAYKQDLDAQLRALPDDTDTMTFRNLSERWYEALGRIEGLYDARRIVELNQ